MAILIDPNDGNTEIIAYLLKDNQIESEIGYQSPDDIPEDTKALRKIRLNMPNEAFFPSITDYNKEEQVDRVYITGPTGCGKTSFIRGWVRLFMQIYPEARIMLFSSKSTDKLLDDLNIERMHIDDDTVIDKYTLDDLTGDSKPSLCIFDDIEDFPSAKINKEISRLRDEVMRNGRSYGIYSLFVHHDPCNYKETKSQIFECNKVVIFPKRCGRGLYNYLLEKKLHLTKKDVAVVCELKSTYVCINKGANKYFISDKYIILDNA